MKARERKIGNEWKSRGVERKRFIHDTVAKEGGEGVGWWGAGDGEDERGSTSWMDEEQEGRIEKI
jgi:hypothetical protein